MVLFYTKMNTDVFLWHVEIKEAHFDENNISTIMYNLYNIDYNYEYNVHKSLDFNPILLT